MMQAGKQIDAAVGQRDRQVAINAAEGFMDLAFARGLSVQAPFADKPFILELRLPAEAGARPRRVYADFQRHELMRLEGERVIRHCMEEVNFLPALLKLCRHSDT